MLLLLCWYKDPLQEHIDRSLEQENPVSYITLELYTAVADDKKLLSVLNEYLLDVSDSQIDYNAVFDSVMGFATKV